ncbi:DUF4870 domain-containing protein [candidate division WWE3 bacterium]|uniref:DUF4870 domain-containing protein n=1 Tax=candidate division WWE3 bacterium TaxID=2053526 RepID=A0A955LKS7_UNCKA|nr:DUF4870 domain-containing protein [candidate division WWE3 bacterium]
MQQTPPAGGQHNTGMAMIAYLLFFVPLLTGDAHKDEFVKFHTNQGTLLFILSVAVSVVGTVVPFLGWFLVIPLGGLFTFVLFVMGIINASKGEMKELPVIGKYQIIK